MGGLMAKGMQPEELVMFKKLPQNAQPDEITIPERPENRVKTDQRYLIAHGVLVLLLMPFLIYTLVYSDIDRMFGKFDNCGNICGKQNERYDQWACTGQDFANKSMLKVHSNDVNYEKVFTPKECVSSCPSNFEAALGGEICLLKGNNKRDSHSLNEVTVSEYGQYLREVAWRITLASFLSLGVTVGALYLFRWATAAMVWSILALPVVLLGLATGFSWVTYLTSSEFRTSGTLFLCIIATVKLVILVCVLVFFSKKIKLVIVLLQEAMKAAFAMPGLMFVPILTSMASVFILALLVTIVVYSSTSGVLTELQKGFLSYEKNFVMYFALAFSIGMTIWSIQIIAGIQYMVIAGAVAKWYFAKNKSHLDSPILTSAFVTFKFHLGTIAFGSLVIAVVAVIRGLISSMVKSKGCKMIADFCMSGLEEILKFLCMNAYIISAMHGKPFYESGKRAAKIIYQNAVNMVSINFIGGFIIALAVLTIMAVSLVFTYAIMEIPGGPSVEGPYLLAPYLIMLCISLIVAFVFFSILETVIDTIFLCFCEDCLMNDGTARPYAMSTSLMEFMDNAKKVFGEKKKD